MMSYLIHLRLHFQILLSPIFLWGYLLADGRPSLKLLLAYCSFHLFGYAGGTALNSFYDRDEGPIGGLANPPPIPDGLLIFALLWQLIGWGLALGVNFTFASIYVVMFCLSLAYSHPRTRWKGKPLLALLTVAMGQGVLACLGGWATAGNEIGSAFSTTGLFAIGAVTLMTTGFYPLTQIYQMEEDARRGDRTVARWLGPRNSFRFALTLIISGTLTAFTLIGLRYGLTEAGLLGALVIAVIAALSHWGHHFDQQAIMYNFKMIMGLYAVMSIGFLGWIGWHLFG